MADNYLEKRYEEVFGSGRPSEAAHRRPSLDTLLHANRSTRGFDKSYKVHRRQLEAIVAVNPLLASSVNMQMLRFRLVTADEAEAVRILQQHTRMGRGLPELNLPFPGTEPEAFIVVCTTVPENASVLIDLGISLEAMTLKTVELGLSALIIRNFDPADVKAGLALPLDPIAVVAIGRSAEKIELVPLPTGKEHPAAELKYYRENGVHYVPKIQVPDLII